MNETPTSNTIQVVTFENEDLSRGPSDLITASLDVARLRDHLRALVAQLHEMVTWDHPAGSGFRLEEVEFSAEITAEGEFKLMGVGATAGAKGAIKFVLKREATAAPPPAARPAPSPLS